jgi:acylphosphatase
MKKCLEIVIKGSKVHGVGYRPFLATSAFNLGIKDLYAYNLKGSGEEILTAQICGSKDRLDQYVEFIRSNYPTHAEVSSIDVHDFEGEVMEAIHFLQILQFEQISKGIPAILNTESLQRTMLDKQDQMLDKQDKSIELLKGIKDDTSAIKADTSAIKADTSAIKADTSAIKADTSAIKAEVRRWVTLEEKVEELSQEIVEIKADLSEIKAKVS